MQKIFQSLLLALLLLLPFHAFGVTVFNNLLYGNEFGAPFWMKAWKEIFLLGIFCIGGIMWIQKIFSKKIKFDLLDLTILIFSFLALVISLLQGVEISQLIYGIKYDLLPLWLFLIVKHVAFDKSFFHTLLKNIGYIGSIVIFLGLFFLFLPAEVFVALGYSADTSFHALSRPLASCQMISFTEICRAQSTLSGPNQLGAYLLFLLPLFSYLFGSTRNNASKIFWVMSIILGTGLLFLTFSRSAWIGIFLGGIFFLAGAKNISIFLPEYWRKILLTLLLIFPLWAGIFAVSAFPESTEKIIARSASSSEHYQKSLEGIEHIIQNPLGSGLGTAGAASKYSSQAQASEKAALIPENWYLQLGIETGIGGMFLFILIVFLILEKISHNIPLPKKSQEKNIIRKAADFLSGKKIISDQEEKNAQEKFSLQSIFLLSCLLALSVMALMLHSWESAVVSYSFWAVLGVYFGMQIKSAKG